MQFDMSSLMKQAQEMQSKIADAKKDAEAKEVRAEAGGGMVEVIMTGNGRVKKINIDKALINPDEPQMLEDLIIAAVNKANAEVASLMSDSMGNLTEGLPNIPGLNNMFK